MTLTKEKLESMTSVEELINTTETIRTECIYAYCDNGMTTNQEIKNYEQLETYAYTRAVEISATTEELEKCAIAIEENSVYYPDPDAWADQVRILAYGFEWYCKQQLSSVAHQEFKKYLQANDLKNPFEQLELAINC